MGKCTSDSDNFDNELKNLWIWQRPLFPRSLSSTAPRLPSQMLLLEGPILGIGLEDTAFARPKQCSAVAGHQAAYAIRTGGQDGRLDWRTLRLIGCGLAAPFKHSKIVHGLKMQR